MCLVKTPKIAPAAKEKEITPLRNPYLDGIDPIVRARQTGVSALRIDRGSKPVAPKNNTAPLPGQAPVQSNPLMIDPGTRNIVGSPQIKRASVRS